MTFEVWQNGSLIESKDILLETNGDYYFEPSVEGDVLIRAKADHWLAESKSVTLPSAADINFSLINGDITGDNRINVLDYIQLKANYNKTGVAGHPVDLNGDARVNVLDYIILKKNYNKIGK